MVLLHHEIEIDFQDGKPAKSNRATLLEFGRTAADGKTTTTAMALTVGIPAAVGALVSIWSRYIFCHVFLLHEYKYNEFHLFKINMIALTFEQDSNKWCVEAYCSRSIQSW